MYREQINEDLADLDARELKAGRKTGNKYGYEYLTRCVVEALNSKGIPPNLVTMTTDRIRSIIEDERERINRVRRWNKTQATPPDS